jgi:hypothetical protein
VHELIDHRAHAQLHVDALGRADEVAGDRFVAPQLVAVDEQDRARAVAVVAGHVVAHDQARRTVHRAHPAADWQLEVGHGLRVLQREAEVRGPAPAFVVAGERADAGRAPVAV